MPRSSRSSEATPRGPLADLRVVDFSQGVAGPSCAMLLGDLGADVIKVEPPQGDWLRGVGSCVRDQESSAHLSLNRNKRSFCVDLKKQEGREVALRLAQRADVIVQNFRPGVMDKLGLGYPSLSTANPRLIFASISGFGDRGPLACAPATDSTMQAFGGLMSINGDEDTPPLRMGNMVSDMLAGSDLCQGVLAALLELARTGRGQRVSVSLLDAVVAFQAAPLMEHAVTGQLPSRSGRNHPLISPAGSYAVKDGFVSLVATQPHWPRFCAAFGLSALTHEPRFATNEQRVAHRDELRRLVEAAFEDRTLQDVVRLARDHDLVMAPINDYDTLVHHEQVQAVGLLQSWRHPVLGEHRSVRNPIVFERTPLQWSPPPMLGEHTQQILRDELRCTPAEITALAACGAAVLAAEA